MTTTDKPVGSVLPRAVQPEAVGSGSTGPLGPAGVLPPGNWLRGADVVHAGSFIIPDGEPGVVIGGGASSAPWVYWVAKAKCVSAARERLRLDLSGDLSHGTRALLHLVAPEVPQPRCPPIWLRMADAWRLFLVEDVTGGWIFEDWSSELDRKPETRGGRRIINSTAGRETDIGAALALALEAT